MAPDDPPRMKVYVATDGSWSEYQVLTVCSTYELAAEIGSNEPLEFEVLDSMPERRTLYRISGNVSRPDHPTNWSEDLLRNHFHTMTTYDCFICNPGHTNVDWRKCPACKVETVRGDQSRVVFPWDYGAEFAVSPPIVGVNRSKTHGGWINISVDGSVKTEVEAAWRAAEKKARADLKENV